MSRKFLIPITLLFALFLLAGCAPRTSLAPATFTPSALPPTPTEIPTDTPIPPAPTETPVITPSATITPTYTIPHLPIGQEFTVTAINMIDASVGWSIGGLLAVPDHILRTTDGGSTWTDLTPPQEPATDGQGNIATGFFQDANTAWVTYSNGSGMPPSISTVWRTTDGGVSWLPSEPLDTSELNESYYPSHLQFVPGGTGWLLVHVGVGMNHDYVVLYRSSDGGQTWERLIDPYNDTSSIMSCQKTNMLFTDATHGWLTGDCNGVAAGVLLFRSSDGGSTWQRITLPSPPDAPDLFTNMQAACGSYDPFFFSNDLGHIGVRCTNYDQDPVTYQYYVYTTPDGGNSWDIATYPGVSLYFLNADTGWALAPKINHTTDGGATWTPISDVTWTAQVDFVDDQVGWGVARENNQVALVKTTNGGALWSMLTPTVGG